jgi:hypothetical protein
MSSSSSRSDSSSEDEPKKKRKADDSDSDSSEQETKKAKKEKKRKKKESKEKKKKKEKKKEKKKKKDKKEKKSKANDDAQLYSPPGNGPVQLSSFFEGDGSPNAEYSVISGKKIKRSIEMTEEDKKSEAKRLKKLEKLNSMGGQDMGSEWGSAMGKFDPKKLKDPSVDKFMQTFQMVNQLAAKGFNPKAEAKKQERHCNISFPTHYG